MKVVHVSPRYHPHVGGVETHVRRLCESFVSMGIDVKVLCTDPTGKLPRSEEIGGINVVRVKSFAPGDAFFFAPKIRGILEDERCDVIHAHSFHALPSFFASLANNPAKFVFTPHYHGTGHTFTRRILMRIYRRIGKRVFERAQKIIAVSKFEADLIAKHFGVPSIIIPNGVDAVNVEASRDPKMILYVGRLEKYKGVHHLMRLLGVLEDFHLCIVGTGPYEGKLRKLSRKLGVESRVRWMGWVSGEELKKLYASAGILALLSSHEAFGMCVAEALSAGTPCVVSRRGALTEFIDGEMCIGVDLPPDISELAEIVNKLAGRAMKPRKFLSWDEVAERTLRVYQE